jgi:hypothetical protein
MNQSSGKYQLVGVNHWVGKYQLGGVNQLLSMYHTAGVNQSTLQVSKLVRALHLVGRSATDCRWLCRWLCRWFVAGLSLRKI